MREVPGDLVKPTELVGRRARQIVAYLSAHHSDYLRLIECRRKDSAEFVVVEIDIEVASRRPVKIAPTERLMLICGVEGTDTPSVVPLREDFPRDQLHVTIHGDRDLVSLCLWDVPEEDLKARFTPFMFLARIKQWLELAAEGQLHQADQGAEPVLMGIGFQAIVPSGPLDPNIRYTATGQQTLKSRVTIRFTAAEKRARKSADGESHFVLIPVSTNRVEGRAVRSAPQTLGKLATMLAEHGCDLKRAVTDFVMATKSETELGNSLPIILVTFPKGAAREGSDGEKELWAFGITESLAELGKALGAYDSAEGYTAPLIGVAPDVEALPELAIEPMLVLRELEADSVSVLSGMTGGENLKCLAIGVGAIGSKVVEICARGGFGRWSLVDMDTFLPHNAIRHILGDWAIGDPKAPYVQNFLNQVIPGDPIVEALVEDVTDASHLSEQAKRALKENDIIVDMSASVAVARHLALQTDIPRCVSLFFNPSATDLVLLAEDRDRSISLIDLEASYYATLIEDKRLQHHLLDRAGRAIRYGNGCRDITAQIGPDQVSLLASLAVKGLRQCIPNTTQTAKVWKSAPDGSVEVIGVSTARYRGEAAGEWDVRWSEELIERVSAARLADLPNETGGILLGIADFERRLIRLSSAIEAPPDSVKRPHYFERGKTGLEDGLRQVGLATAGQMRYLGEWHSHPKGVPARPSGDDERLFSVLTKEFRGTGEPHLMAIVGDDQLFWRIGLEDEVFDAAIPLAI